jgi:hypothetical protein
MSDEKLDQILAKTIRIEAALWPDEGQPGVLSEHDDRLGKLENWRTGLAYAWGAVTTLFSVHWIGKHGG